jgi:hypothetical protein
MIKKNDEKITAEKVGKAFKTFDQKRKILEKGLIVFPLIFFVSLFFIKDPFLSRLRVVL